MNAIGDVVLLDQAHPLRTGVAVVDVDHGEAILCHCLLALLVDKEIASFALAANQLIVFIDDEFAESKLTFVTLGNIEAFIVLQIKLLLALGAHVGLLVNETAIDARRKRNAEFGHIVQVLSSDAFGALVHIWQVFNAGVL